MSPSPDVSPIGYAYQFVLLALVLWREARGCSREEKVAIAHVIVNRATDPMHRWPKSVAGVICQPVQFTSIAPPAHITPAEMANAVAWPKDDDPHFLECCLIADQFGSATENSDATGGATNYYSDPIPSLPAWADPAKQTAHIGVFHFFKL